MDIECYDCHKIGLSLKSLPRSRLEKIKDLVTLASVDRVWRLVRLSLTTSKGPHRKSNLGEGREAEKNS